MPATRTSLPATPYVIAGLDPAISGGMAHSLRHEMPRSSPGIGGLAARAGLALATKANCTYPADWVANDALLKRDLAPLPELVRGEEGTLGARLWAEPGLGVEPDPEVLEEYCVNRTRI